MKKLLLATLMIASTLVGTTSLSNEAQAAGINGEPDPRMWVCVYKLHDVVRLRETYTQQVECPVYTGAELAEMAMGSQTVHGHNKSDDHECTEVFGYWG